MSVLGGEQYGGAASDFFSTVILVEEIAKVDMGISAMLEVQNNLIIPFVEMFGSDELKNKYLPRLVKDTVMLNHLDLLFSRSEEQQLYIQNFKFISVYLL